MAHISLAVTVLLSFCRDPRAVVFPRKNSVGGIVLGERKEIYRKGKENRASNGTREKVHPGCFRQTTAGMVSPDKPEGHENQSIIKNNNKYEPEKVQPPGGNFY